MLQLEVDGQQVEVVDAGGSLLDVLREQLGITAVKDGCSPQGQCGCCTVLVDGAPRVSCVTPARRVAGRRVTTLEGMDDAARDRWAGAFRAAGASQCGFCTPGIIVRLAALEAKAPGAGHDQVEQALLAHLCRCTGWRTILDAWDLALATTPTPAEPATPDDHIRRARVARSSAPPEPATPDDHIRRARVASSSSPTEPATPDDHIRRARVASSGGEGEGAERRAWLEGGGAQRVGPEVALGHGGFADDTAPAGALVAVPDGAGGWAVGDTLTEARAAAGKVQGRRTTEAPSAPIELPPGAWDLTLQTSWVEPAYLELDASWCEPGGEPASPLANGGAFGAKLESIAPRAARELADEHGRAVRVVLAREDTVRLGPKRPPIAAGVRADGTGIVRVARTPGIAAAISSVAPELDVEEVDVTGPPTSAALRGAGWVEAAVLRAALGHHRSGDAIALTAPNRARATARWHDGRMHVSVACGPPLDEVVLRSYCVGAAHMAMSWVTSEALAVAPDGEVLDLTIRSFGILRAVDTPPIDVTIDDDGGEPRNGSDAVFAAVAAATWVAQGLTSPWPTRQHLR